MESITVEGRLIGQKRPLFTGWQLDLPGSTGSSGQSLTLRGLITLIVTEEVHAFKRRQQERRLARILSPSEIQAGVKRGKVDLGERELNQEVDEAQAITNALQSFEDGLYFVFVDGEQQIHLDQEVSLKPGSLVSFVRLVALAGG
jgi:hypothetical protein